MRKSSANAVEIVLDVGKLKFQVGLPLKKAQVDDVRQQILAIVTAGFERAVKDVRVKYREMRSDT